MSKKQIQVKELSYSPFKIKNRKIILAESLNFNYSEYTCSIIATYAPKSINWTLGIRPKMCPAHIMSI